MKIISSWRDEPGYAWRARFGDSIALEFGDTGLQRRHQRNELFPRWFCR
jgi:hypothetical protein